MAIHEHHTFGAPDNQPAAPHPHDDDAFTTGCPECEAARAVLSIEAELRFAIRDLWFYGWVPSEIAEEVRHRTNSIDARDLIIRALLAEDAVRSDQATTKDWTQEVTFLATASGIEAHEVGWLPLWVVELEDHDAARTVLLAVFDALHDMQVSAA